jgi:predicted MFS family arabinose efflux permease
MKALVQLYRNSYSGLSRQIWLLSLVMLINRSGTMVVPFMTLYCRHLGYTTGQAGSVVAVYGLGSILGAFLGGRISDRFGFYPTQFGALFMGGLLFLLLGQMQTYEGILLVTFFLSMVNESFRPANSTAIARYSTPQNRTQAYSVVRLAINVGWGVGSALGGILASIDYHWLFWVDGFTNISAAILLISILPRVKSGTRYATDVPAAAPLHKPYHDRIFMYFLGLQVCFALCFFQLFTTVPLYFKEGLQLKESVIGILMAGNGILIASVEMVLVFSLEGRKPYLFLMGVGTLLMALTYLLLNATFLSGVAIGVLFIVVITVAEMVSMPFMNSFYISRSAEHNRGQYAGMYTMAWSTAQVIGSACGAWAASHFGFANLWWIVGFICTATAFGYFRLQQALARH